MINDMVDGPKIEVLSGNSRLNVVKIRAHIYKNKKLSYIQICIGINIVSELGWKNGDSISFESSLTKDFVLLKKIDKITNKIKYESYEYLPIKGYVLRKIKNSYSYSVNLPCNYTYTENLKIKVVDHEVIDENGNKFLKVYLNGKKDEK